MMSSRVAILALVALVLGVAGARAAPYSCPSTCEPKLGCMCPSNKPPAGMANGDVPQFIVLTNDDAITVISQPIILNVTERHANKNGCKMPATWFVSIDYTDPHLVKNVFVRGHEIATHTINHVSDANVTQIVGARDWLVKEAGIPKSKIGGFRAPFLMFSPEQREILQENDFWFDSSISEVYGPQSPTSPSAAERLWPYTMDYGMPQDCTISTGPCSPDERHPGLWEFPMWNIQDATGVTVASMDPLGDPYELYKLQFDERYDGNRAPLGIFLHAAWLLADPTRADRLNQFLEYAMSKENVFLVTVSQVLDWMKNPVPASEYSPNCPSEKELMDMLPEGTQICVMPNEGCEYGTFDSATCKCKCQNEEINAAGYCLDATTGRCTVQKGYDFNAKTYTCPPAGAAPVAAAPSASQPATDGAAATTPVNTPNQPMTIEMDVSGTSPADFQASKADAFCAQLLRLTGDSTATCTVVSVVSVSGRRLLQDKVHVIAKIETKNADATVAAINTDTVYTLLTPAGISVVPNTVKAALGAPVLPAPAPTTDTTVPADTAAGTDTVATTGGEAAAQQGDDVAAAPAPTGDSSSNTGAIVGAVVGSIAGVALIAGGVFMYMRRRKATAVDADAQAAARNNSYNPAFDAGARHNGGVTATIRTTHSPSKKEMMLEAAVGSESPLRDSMARSSFKQ